MNIEKISIFGVNVFNITFEESMEILKGFLKEDRLHTIFTPNTEIVMACNEDENLKDLINSADLVVADGIGLVIGSKMRGKPLKERVTGYDISMELIELAQAQGHSLYFVGGEPGIAMKAKENVEKDYPGINIVGEHHGYFKGTHLGHKGHAEEMELVKDINEKCPDIIFLGLGFPKQEIWIDEYRDKLNAKIIIGNGGVLDVLAGKAQRAPEIFIKLNLEWFYRLLKNPSRIKRQMAIPKFLFKIMTDRDSVK